MNEALPRLMFAHQWTEELKDKRLGSEVKYKQQSDGKLTKINQSKFVSEVPIHSSITKQLAKNTSIHNAKYISSMGKMFVNTADGIAVYDYIEDIQAAVKQELKIVDKQQKPMEDLKNLNPPKIVSNANGLIYVSPNEKKMAVLSETQLIILGIQDKIIQLESIKFEQGLTFSNGTWSDDNVFFLWKFQKNLYVLDLSKEQKEIKMVEQVEKCTGGGILQTPNKQAYILDYGTLHLMEGSSIKSSIILCAEEGGKENLDDQTWQFMCLIGVQIVQKGSDTNGFSKEDIYALTVVYYRAVETDDEEPCNRYLAFMKGDLEDTESLKVRGNQLILSNNNDESLYLKQGDEGFEQLEFQCIMENCGQALVVLVEKTQFLAIVDSELKFQKLNIFSPDPIKDFKIHAKQFENQHQFKSLTIMRTMLPFQEQKPAQQNKYTDLYCKQQYKGQFLKLYFAAKESQVTIEFPLSVISFTDNKFYRKYLISTSECIEDDRVEIIQQKFLKKHKKSRNIENIQKKIEYDVIRTLKENQKEQEALKQIRQEKQNSVKKEEVPEKVEEKQLQQSEKVQKKQAQKEQKPLPDADRGEQKKNEPTIMQASNNKKEEKEEQSQKLTEKQQQSKPDASAFSQKKDQQNKLNLSLQAQKYQEKADQKNSQSFSFSSASNKPEGGIFGKKEGISFGNQGGMFNPSKSEATEVKVDKDLFPSNPFAGKGLNSIQKSQENQQNPRKDNALQTKKLFNSTLPNFNISHTNMFGPKQGEKIETGSNISSNMFNKQKNEQKKPGSSIKQENIQNSFANNKSPQKGNNMSTQPTATYSFGKSSAGIFNTSVNPSPFGNTGDQASKKLQSSQISQKNPSPLIMRSQQGLEKQSSSHSFQNLKIDEKIKPQPKTQNIQGNASQEKSESEAKTKQVLQVMTEDVKKFTLKKIQNIKNFIEIFVSKNVSKNYFTTAEAENIIRQFDNIWKLSDTSEFKQIEESLYKLQQQEKAIRSIISSSRSDEQVKKSKIIKNIGKLQTQVDAICYFYSFFKNTKGSPQTNSLASIISKKRNPMSQGSKIQAAKYLALFRKKTDQLGQQAQIIHKKYKEFKQKNPMSAETKNNKFSKFSFNDVDISSSSSEDQQMQIVESQIMMEYERQKKLADAKRSENNITGAMLCQSLQKLKIKKPQYQVKNMKPIIKISMLDQQIQQDKQSSDEDRPSIIKTKKTEQSTLKKGPFEAKIPKARETHVFMPQNSSKTFIPIIKEEEKEQSIAESQEIDDNDNLEGPILGSRKITAVPIMKDSKKEKQSSTHEKKEQNIFQKKQSASSTLFTGQTKFTTGGFKNFGIKKEQQKKTVESFGNFNTSANNNSSKAPSQSLFGLQSVSDNKKQKPKSSEKSSKSLFGEPKLGGMFGQTTKVGSTQEQKKEEKIKNADIKKQNDQGKQLKKEASKQSDKPKTGLFSFISNPGVPFKIGGSVVTAKSSQKQQTNKVTFKLPTSKEEKEKPQDGQKVAAKAQIEKKQQKQKDVKEEKKSQPENNKSFEINPDQINNSIAPSQTQSDQSFISVNDDAKKAQKQSSISEKPIQRFQQKPPAQAFKKEKTQKTQNAGPISIGNDKYEEKPASLNILNPIPKEKTEESKPEQSNTNSGGSSLFNQFSQKPSNSNFNNNPFSNSNQAANLSKPQEPAKPTNTMNSFSSAGQNIGNALTDANKTSNQSFVAQGVYGGNISAPNSGSHTNVGFGAQSKFLSSNANTTQNQTTNNQSGGFNPENKSFGSNQLKSFGSVAGNGGNLFNQGGSGANPFSQAGGSGNLFNQGGGSGNPFNQGSSGNSFSQGGSGNSFNQGVNNANPLNQGGSPINSWASNNNQNMGSFNQNSSGGWSPGVQNFNQGNQGSMNMGQQTGAGMYGNNPNPGFNMQQQSQSNSYAGNQGSQNPSLFQPRK